MSSTIVVLGIGEPIPFLKNSKNFLSVSHVYVYVHEKRR